MNQINMMLLQRNKKILYFLFSLSLILLSGGSGFYLGSIKKENEVIELYNNTFEIVQEPFDLPIIKSFEDLKEQLEDLRYVFDEVQSNMPTTTPSYNP